MAVKNIGVVVLGVVITFLVGMIGLTLGAVSGALSILGGR